MTAALWTIMSSDDGNGPYIGVVADEDGADYVLPGGKINPKLTEARVEAIAISRGAPPTTPGGWVKLAAFGLGPVKLSKYHAAADIDKARAEVAAAINALHRLPSGARAQRLTEIAEAHDIFALENADAFDEAASVDHKDYSVWNADWSAGPEAEKKFISDALSE